MLHMAALHYLMTAITSKDMLIAILGGDGSSQLVLNLVIRNRIAEIRMLSLCPYLSTAIS